MRATDIAGTYKLVARTLADGKLASESSIIRYTLSASRYCEWIAYTVRNNLDTPGLTNGAPPVTDHCTPAKVERGKIIFAPPDESVGTTFDRHGFTAGIPGQFVDRWRKVE